MPIFDYVKQAKDRWKANALLMLIMVVGMFLLEVVDLVLPASLSLDRFGVRPRTVVSLPCIFLAPWLHVGFSHVLTNAVMFFVLGWFVSLHGWLRFWRITAAIMLISGLGVFLFGAPATVHLGSSGLVFGYFGFLLARGYYERKPLSILLSGVVLFLYYEMLFKLLSVQPHISWSSHFFGFFGGVSAAWFWYRRDNRSVLAKKSDSPPDSLADQEV